MSALEPVRCRTTLRAPYLRNSCLLLALVLIASGVAGAARAEAPEIEPETIVLIGYRVDSEMAPVEVDTVRVSFEVRMAGAETETYKLKFFDAGFELPPVDPELLGEQEVLVDGVNPLQPEQLWIDEPPVPMKWETVVLNPSITAFSGAMLIAVEMTALQLRQAEVVAFLDETCDEPRTFYSIDGGLTWEYLNGARLECLLGGGCGDDDSIYIRVHVKPG